MRGFDPTSVSSTLTHRPWQLGTQKPGFNELKMILSLTPCCYGYINPTEAIDVLMADYRSLCRDCHHIGEVLLLPTGAHYYRLAFNECAVFVQILSLCWGPGLIHLRWSACREPTSIFMHQWLQDVAEDTIAVSRVGKCQTYTLRIVKWPRNY